MTVYEQYKHFYTSQICCAMHSITIYGLFILQTKQQQPVEVENQSFTESHRSYLIAVTSAIFTDLLDGYFARLLSQCSTLGIFLDVVADNILRTTLWVGAIVVEPKCLVLGTMVICLEWSTFVSQLTNSKNWVTGNTETPLPWMYRVFENGFRIFLVAPVSYHCFSHRCTYF